LDAKVTTWVAVAITATWVAANVVSFLRPAYKPDQSVGLSMMAVAGALFGHAVIKARNGKNGDHP
jgi:hypothetical protein